MVSREDPERPFLGSMGIYVFKTQLLMDLLTEHPDFDDFGSDVIPHAIDCLPVFGFDFDGYWQDIGTIRSFYDTNLALTRPDAPFSFHDPQGPIYTHSRFLPGSIVTDSLLRDTLLTEGCVIQRATIERSIIGLRSRIEAGAVIRDSYVMGADYYSRDGRSAPGIGEGCHVEGAILDKNVRLEEGVTIRPYPRGTDLDGGCFAVQDGIVVVPKGTVLPRGTKIGPD
jgi:glucose-1-phosphate adenylyltransferase